jgi:phosphatidylinositol alpha-1,6-mannosyltransferase
VLGAARREPPDVIIALHVNLLPVALLAGKPRRARVVMFGHGIEVWAPLPWWTRRFVAGCDRLLAVSSFTAEWMARRARIDVNRVKVVTLPVAQRFADEADDTGSRTQDDAPRAVELLSVCRLVPAQRSKGYFDVANALPHVLAERPAVRWRMVGHGPDLAALREHCEHLGIGHAVEIPGRVEDDVLVESYRRADVFVLPTWANPEAVPPVGEGFGLVFAEAAMFGLPLIGSTEGGGSLDLVMDGHTGLTVPPNDQEALVRAILRLVDDRDLRERLGNGARALIESRHLPSQFSAALLAACR